DLTEALQKVEYEKLQKYDWFLKRELNPIVRENKKVFKRRNKRHQLLREIRRVIRAKNKRRRLYRLLYDKIFIKLPLKEDLIFFESFNAKKYADSPKAIYEKLLEKNKDYKVVLSFRETGKHLPGKPVQVKRFSLRYFYYLAREKYLVNTVRFPRSLTKLEGRSEQHTSELHTCFNHMPYTTLFRYLTARKQFMKNYLKKIKIIKLFGALEKQARIYQVNLFK